ncbi:DUF4491 family protein [Clostridium sp. NSJ-6]|uniref:DUF4491 family protein n=1 Tax=Clostridium hominis TaxID=2763036 RepID=A0ABR7DBB8_9CLOT|nr:DUF4491 family protein [Clostridium hominis]MBC5628697.1 DUF4491 family protein [Clostridium hominis]
MNFDGIIIGLISFLIIGLFHPIVIKGEYYFSKRIWPIFLVVGIVFLALSLYVDNSIFTASLGVIGFSCLWSIKEIFEQEERVKKGWYPKKPR